MRDLCLARGIFLLENYKFLNCFRILAYSFRIFLGRVEKIPSVLKKSPIQARKNNGELCQLSQIFPIIV